jgi:hypothetical protein
MDTAGRWPPGGWCHASKSFVTDRIVIGEHAEHRPLQRTRKVRFSLYFQGFMKNLGNIMLCPGEAPR